MEKQKFEDAFKDAFDGSEIYPSDSVWTNIEQDLDKRSGKKGLLILIQLLAAASMVFAMGVGSVYYLSSPQIDESTLSTTVNAPESSSNEKRNEQKVTTPSMASLPSSSAENQPQEKVRQSDLIASKEVVAPSQSMASVNLSQDITAIQFNENRLPELAKVKQPELLLPPANEPDPGMLMLARLRDEERKYETPRKKSKEKLWTSVGVGAGSFNPHIAQGGVPDGVRSFGPQTLGGTPKKDPIPTPSTGTTYSVGINVATKVANRLVVQGGISYLTQNAELTSTTAIKGKAALNGHAVDGEDPSTTKPYKVRNNMQYMSLPVQAGYIIVDHDFAVQLNGGLATDIFIQNTLTPEKTDLNKTTTRSGSESPYRSVNFSGLLGTEISYKVGDHYRIALNPGLRYALNSIYKSDVSGAVSPITYDVALRFRYIFK